MKNKKILRIIDGCIDKEKYDENKKIMAELERDASLEYREKLLAVFAYGRNAGLWALLGRFEQEIKDEKKFLKG